MNAYIRYFDSSKAPIAAAVAAALLAACAAAPLKPAGAVQVRGKLTVLQADQNLASRAPVAIKEADAAVSVAEMPERDEAVAAHRVYIADHKVDTARAQAETRFAEDQRPVLAEQRESARLAARTREADVANSKVAAARAESAEQKVAADQARGDADAARVAAATAEQESMELQREIDSLQAKVTDRGLVLTLGDVQFTSGRAELREGATDHLDKLITFLNNYPNRTVMIEGFTDGIGSEDANQWLSQRRAEAVKGYLIAQGIGPIRLDATGKGEREPVASNESADGRQQNRRVEIVIDNPAAALR